MQSNFRAGTASIAALVALPILGLSGLAVASQQGRDDQPRQDAPRSTEQGAQAGQGQGAEAITRALSDLRQAVRTELEKSAFLQGKSVDTASLVITTGDQGNAIAGAPTRGATLPGGGIGNDRNPPERTQPGEGGGQAGRPGPGHRLEEQQIVGVVMLVGTFRQRLDIRAEVTESSFRGDISGGTFTVRRASANSQTVQIVDANDRTVATVPLIGFPGRTEDRPGQDSTVPADSRSGDKGDWGRIYLSVLHYFHPTMG